MEDKAIKHGPLLTPPQGKLLKRAWQKKYYALYKASGYAVERVEVFDGEDNYTMGISHKIIPLNECIKVAQAAQKNQPNVFEVITKGQSFLFSAETTQELAEWVSAFQLVAFGGGQRRDAGAAAVAPSPHLNRSYSESVRTSVDSNTEEENQIYCSFGEPETYAVIVLETPASSACGLRGEYMLVVGTSQLQLMTEDLFSLLYSWPYRHIRRYGRSSHSFTFEAGRKCASGAGTFSFSTPRGNDIFVSMQASTRNLKREVDGGLTSSAQLTTSSGSLRSLAAPRAVLSWPSMEDGLPPPPPPSSPPPQTRSIALSGNAHAQSNPPSTTTRSTSTTGKSDTKESPPSILDRVLSRTKVIPPFAKPPRRSKLGSPVVSEPTTPSSPEPTFRLEISSAARAKLVAEVSAAASAPHGTGNARRRCVSDDLEEEPTYAVPEMRCDAWKTLGESDDFHRERTPDVDGSNERIYDLVTNSGGGGLAAGGLDAVVPLPQQQQWPGKTVLPSSLVADGYNYDHLSMFSTGHQPTSLPTTSSPNGLSPNGHIYCRLTPTTLTPPSQIGGLPVPSDGRGWEQAVASETVAADYGGTVPDSSSNVESDTEGDIQRFIQNEDVYTAVVKKPLKKLNLSSIEV